MALSKNALVARRVFREEYSSTTAEILKRIARGQDSWTIANALNLELGTVVTTKGNFTRGIYSPFAVNTKTGVGGECRF